MAVVGSAEVVVSAVTSGFKKSVKDAFREARPIAATEGERYGRDFGDRFRVKFKPHFQEAFRELRAWTKDEGERQGKLFGDKFGAELKKSMRAAVGEAFDSISEDIKNRSKQVGTDLSEGIKQGVKDAGPVDMGDVIDTSGVAASMDRATRDVSSSARNMQNSVDRNLNLGEVGRRQGRRFAGALTPEFRRAALQANRAFTLLYGIGNIVGTALGLVIGGLASLINSLFALTAAASQAVGSLIVLPSLLTAIAQAAITAAFAFSGVGKAIGAGFKAAEADVGGTTSAVNNAAKAVADARKALTRVYEDNARRVRDANYRIVDAEKDVVDAQEEARLAQFALNQAYEIAAERLQQLAFNVEGAALSEERAVLRLQRATQELAEVQANPASTAQELQDASLNYREAELALRMAQDAYADIQEEQEAAAEAGVEGSAEVVQAQNDLVDANNRVADTMEALRRAQEDLRDTEIDNARALQDAQERLADALARQADAYGSANSAASAYQKALDDLSPAARDFVEYIVSIREEFKKLKTAAGEELFPKLKASIQDVVANFFPALEGALRTSGSALGDFALSVSSVVASAGFIARFTQVAENNANTIRQFGDIVASVINAISGVLVAAGPITYRFTSYIERQADAFERYATSGAGIGEMAQYFERAGDTAAQLWTILGNVWDGIMAIGSAAVPAGDMLLDKLEEISDRFADFNSGALRQNELENFFFDSAKAGSEVLGLLWDIAKAFARLGTDPAITASASLLRESWVPVLEELLTKVIRSGEGFSKFLISVTELLNAFADTSSIDIFFEALNGIVVIIKEVAESGFGAFLLSIVGPLVAIGKAVSLARIALGFFGKAIVGSVLSLTGLSGAFTPVIAQLGRLRMAFQLTNQQMLASAAASSTAAAAQANVAALMGGTVTASVARATTGLSGLVKGFTAVRAGAAVLGASLYAALGPLGLLMLGVTAVVGAISYFSRKQKEAEQRSEEFTQSLDEAHGAITAQTYDKFAEEIDESVIGSFDRVGISVDELMGYVDRGEEGIEDLRARLHETGMSTAQVNKRIDEAKDLQKEWTGTVADATKAWNEQHKGVETATGVINDYSDAAARATVIIEDNSYAQEIAADYVKQLNDQYKDLVSSFSLLDDAAVSQERSNLRAAESFANLGEKINIANGGLDISTEAGRNNREGILDHIEALNQQAQANLDAGMAAEEVQAQYEANKKALIDTIAPTGDARKAVEDYINTIELTPEEKTTRFTAIIEEQALLKAVEGLDAVTQARVATIFAENDGTSLSDVYRALVELIEDDWTVPIPTETLDLAIAQVQADIASLKIDPETNQPWAPELMPQANKDAIARSEEDLRILTEKKRNPQIEPQVNSSQANEDLDAIGRKKTKPSVEPQLTDIVDNIPERRKREVGSRLLRGLSIGGRRAEGGPIRGPGGPKEDRAGLFALSNGEFVLSAKSVQALGGLDAVSAIHNRLKWGGSPPRLAAGGIVSPAAGGTLTVLAEAGRSERVEPLDSRGLSPGDRALLEELAKLREAMMNNGGGGTSVAIGTIVSPSPTEAASEIVDRMRSEAYRMGRYR